MKSWNEKFVQLIIISFYFYFASPLPRIVIECEKKAHLSFSSKQKQQLCQTTTTGDFSIGPAVCSVAAKDRLHLPFDDILDLCVEAPSSAPAECYAKIEKARQKSVGLRLCSKMDSSLPGECYNELHHGMWKNTPVGIKTHKSFPVDKDNSIIEFCKNIEDRSALLCVAATKNFTQLSSFQALELCKDVVGSGDGSIHNPLNFMVSSCIDKMAIYIKPSLGIASEDIVHFCAQINHRQYPQIISESEIVAFSDAAVNCFETLTGLISDPSYHGPSLSMKHRLSICLNAPIPLGPVNCISKIIDMLEAKEPHAKLQGDELVKLCSGSTGEGPSECFIESKGIGGIDLRIQLCHAASNYGPAHCYRRANNVFRKDPENKLLLCLSATSEGPAACASSAPQYLSSDEKIHLCEASPVQSFMDPIKCLQAVQSISRNFANAPKKALGYFQENIQLDSDWTSRGLLISLCSFSDSKNPLAAAECFKSVPPSLHHDDAVMMCTNVSSTEVIQHIQLCYRILPKSWSSESVRILCEGLEDRFQTEAAVKCAVELGKLSSFCMDQSDIARICSTETPGQQVLNCVKQLHHRLPTSSPFKNNQTIYSICHAAKSVIPADCLMAVQDMISSSVSFDTDIPQKVCHRADYHAVLKCLMKLNRHLITSVDVYTCSQEKRVASYVRLKRIVTEDNDIEITAGRRFSVWFEIFDQFDQLYAQNVDIFKASINENNAEGSVLWGIRSNSSSHGLLQLNTLVISQPGVVQFKLSLVSQQSQPPIRNSGTILGSFRLTVKPDLRLEKTAPCLFVFHHSQCPDDAREEDWISYFPNIRSFSPATYYLHNIYCSDEESLKSWHVNAYLSANGAMWIDYRQGVDAIWTNIGLPQMEMSAEERLGVSLPTNYKVISKTAKKNLSKIIKRSYYKASLQWHPDRWSGFDRYKYAVQGAFQLITEAYETLMQCLNGSMDVDDGIMNNDDVIIV